MISFELVMEMKKVDKNGQMEASAVSEVKSVTVA